MVENFHQPALDATCSWAALILVLSMFASSALAPVDFQICLSVSRPLPSLCRTKEESALSKPPRQSASASTGRNIKQNGFHPSVQTRRLLLTHTIMCSSRPGETRTELSLQFQIPLPEVEEARPNDPPPAKSATAQRLVSLFFDETAFECTCPS